MSMSLPSAWFRPFSSACCPGVTSDMGERSFASIQRMLADRIHGWKADEQWVVVRSHSILPPEVGHPL